MNRFDDVESVDELLGQMVGAASVCWENPGGAGIFDSTEAKKVVDEGLARLEQITGMMWSN
jgi:hypothetical protein